MGWASSGIGGKMIPILRPCFQRPEMLQLSLEFQEQNQCQDKFMTFFFADNPSDPEIIPILNKHAYPKSIIMRGSRLDLTPNILEAYKWLFENIKTDFVAIIEDDIIVSQDWLKMMLWFARNNKDENVMAFNAGDLRDKELAGDLQEIKYINWYYSCASIISRNIFEKYILPHCKQEYYQNKDKYLRKHFPGILEGQLLDQAGLFRRIRIKHGLKVICPVYRRFGHIGVYGRFQRGSPLGDLATKERYEILKNACRSRKELEKWVEWKSGNFVDFNENTDFNGQLHFREA
jgi:hypothetical protein